MFIFSILLACSDQEAPNNDPAQKAKVEQVEKKKGDDKKGHEGHQSKGEHSHAKKGEHSPEKDGSNSTVAAVPANAKVFFASPKNGEQVSSPVTIKMGVEGLKVQPAGEIVDGTSHHHIIIDADSVPQGKVVPADDKHKHFGKGQTETSLELSAGDHTLRLQFADGAHRSYGPQMEQTIKITVK